MKISQDLLIFGVFLFVAMGSSWLFLTLFALHRIKKLFGKCPEKGGALNNSSQNKSQVRKKVESKIRQIVRDTPRDDLRAPDESQVGKCEIPIDRSGVLASFYRYLYDDIVKTCSELRPANDVEYLVAVKMMLTETPGYNHIRAGFCDSPPGSILLWSFFDDSKIRLHISISDGDRYVSVKVHNTEALDLIEGHGAIVQ